MSFLSGIIISAQKTLKSIGELFYMYDYRNELITENPDNSSTRITRWNDQSGNSFNVRQYFTATANAFFKDVDGTVLLDIAGGVQEGFKFDDFAYVRGKNKLNAMHDGSAWMAFFVVKFPTGTTGSFELFMMNTATSPGVRIFIQSNRTVRMTIYDSSGTQQVNCTSTGTIPNDEWCIVCVTYYGISVGAADTRITIKSTTQTFNTAGTLSAGNFSGNIVMRTNAVSAGDRKVNIKLNGAYNLVGKSVAQIDAFLADFYTTLKSDPEYASLVTP